MEEVWKDIPGYEGRYQVSDHGRVKSLDRLITYSDGRSFFTRGKALALVKLQSGHLTVRLQGNFYYVHHLVLLTFVSQKPQSELRIECRHLDGDAANNRVGNLQWGTVKENRADRRRLGEKAKLTRGQMHELQRYLRQGMKVKDAAAMFGIDRHTVANYREGRMYA